MRITDLLDKRSVSLTAAPKTKSETLDMAVDLMVKSEKISNREAYRKQVYLREEESTTGIGEGIAIPHGKCDAVKKPGLAAMVIKNGVEFEALDDEPVTLLFLIAAPNTEDNIHLDVLSKLSVMLMDEEFTESLRNASSVDEFMDIIDRADSEKKDIDERLADTGSAEGTQAKILAVTSCPTGIAHTYMAAEGIEKVAKAIHNPDQGVYGICLRGKAGWGDNMALLTTMANTFGAQWFDKDGRPQLTSDAWNNTLNYYVDLLTKYGPPGSSGNSFNEILALFNEGKCGMWIDATIAASFISDPAQSKVADKVAFAQSPVSVTNKGANWL